MAEALGRNEVIPRLENLLQKYSGSVLHPNHYLLIRTVHSLTQLYGRIKKLDDLEMAELKQKKSHCEHLLKVIDVIEPGLSRIRGSLSIFDSKILHIEVFAI